MYVCEYGLISKKDKLSFSYLNHLTSWLGKKFGGEMYCCIGEKVTSYRLCRHCGEKETNPEEKTGRTVGCFLVLWLEE